MNLKEWQGKEIFRKYGVKVPKSVLIKNPEELKGINYDGVLKAQVLKGGRGKAELIIPATKEEAVAKARELFSKSIDGEKIEEILFEERIDVEKEYYFSIAIDGNARKAVVVFSKKGGMDIEKLAKEEPRKIVKIYVDRKFSFEKVAERTKLDKKLIEALYKIFRDYDAELVEINPLALTPDNIIALDSKIIIDDNSLYRHKEFNKETELTELERLAASYGLSYVELDGDIAVIGNGAGLVMATLDAISYFGGRVANFLDVGGGAGSQKMEKALEIALKKKPRGLFVNILGGITRCDEMVKGLADYRKAKGITIPFVTRLTGTNEDEAKKIAKEAGIEIIESINSMEEGAKRIVEAARKWQF